MRRLPVRHTARITAARLEAIRAVKKLTRIRGVLPSVLRPGVLSNAIENPQGSVALVRVADGRHLVHIQFLPGQGWLTEMSLNRMPRVFSGYHEEAEGMLQGQPFEQTVVRFAQLLIESRMVRPELDVNDVRRRLLGTGAGVSTRSNPSASEFHDLARQARVGLDYLTMASSHVTALRVKMQLVVGALERLAQSDDGQPLTPKQAKLAGRAMDFLHHIVLTDPAADAPHIQAARDVAADVVNRVGAAWLARDYARAPARQNPPSGRVTVDNYEGPVVLDLGGQSVRFDNKQGLGAVPDVDNIRYMGMVVMMRPSMFLALALRLNLEDRSERHIEQLPQTMMSPGWGYPFLGIWPEGDVYTVNEHEGRHRCHTLVNLHCDEEIPVAIFIRYFRSRHISPDVIARVRSGLISQNGVFVRGPLFGTAFCDGVEYPPPHAGLYPIG